MMGNIYIKLKESDSEVQGLTAQIAGNFEELGI